MASKENVLSHVDKNGNIKMVDISEKVESSRVAITKAVVKMKKQTLNLIKKGEIKKGNVLNTAKIAGIIASKKTHELIPLCHPISISNIAIDINLNEDDSQVEIISTVSAFSRTGVEMEAFIASAIAAITIYDMCKAIDREIIISDIMLLKKTGGKSGEYVRTKK